MKYEVVSLNEIYAAVFEGENVNISDVFVYLIESQLLSEASYSKHLCFKPYYIVLCNLCLVNTG